MTTIGIVVLVALLFVGVGLAFVIVGAMVEWAIKKRIGG